MNSDPSNKRLSDEENYKTSFTLADLNHSIIGFSKILTNFIKEIAEDIEVTDLNYFLFIVEKGIDTIVNVFKLLLIYTKNYELALYHTEKSCVYYIEFITQIGQNNQHYLDLNTRDAIIFVFKKTIYELNLECKKRTFIVSEQNKLFEIISQTIDFMRELIKITFKNKEIKELKTDMNDFLNSNIETAVKLLILTINTICKNYELNKNTLTNYDEVKILDYLNLVIRGMNTLNCNYMISYNVIIHILKKINKIICSSKENIYNSNTNKSNINNLLNLNFSMDKLIKSMNEQTSPQKIANQLLFT